LLARLLLGRELCYWLILNSRGRKP
jgi:hypothetical protein